ncbi:MAG: hypothetical protein SFW09_06305 [Hyphomicrobiaceae bacterium]|nr:hypothetical protein [Hyphomicrobiaceae bacterium]
MAWLRNRLLLVVAGSVAGLWLVSPDAPSLRRIILAAAPDQAPAWHAALTGRGEAGSSPSAPEVRVAQATSSGGRIGAPSPAVVRTDADSEASGTPSRPDDATRKLARSIQVELKRVGCYDGEVDGAWTATTRRAMQEFNRRVRASLATERPDYILLTLLQGHTPRACGDVCPLGHAMGADGACRPRALQAEERKGSPDSDPAPWAKAIAEAVASSRQAGGAADGERPGLAARDERRQSERAVAGSIGEPRRLAEESMPRGAADALVQRRAAAEKAVAEAERARAAAAAERARIAALEERKRQQTAMAQAHAEAERARRLTEAETARIEAEARRRAELIALAARAVQPKSVPLRPALPAGASALGGPVEVRSTSMSGTRPTAGPVDQPRPVEGASIAALAADAAAPEPRTEEEAPRGAAAASPPTKPRFVAPFVPPPASRVGRLPPRPRLAPPARVVQRPAAVYRYTAAPSVQSIFLRTQRGSP